ncbi:MAG TPA: S-methyl-5'-thioadenosine phosphorylase [Firmicutes bacterium]|nr:S-methyl-5'-thioadenosine phosphorylase [Bacillota bacterium]
MNKANIGIFGGSGFYSLLDNVEEIAVDTPYGAPSDRIAIAEIAGKKVAFLPRHGKNHQLPPHLINYRANLWAMKSLGVQQIIGPCAAGSLQEHVKPGDFVIVDQFVNRTWGRTDSFVEGPNVAHLSAAEPYCGRLRKIAAANAKKIGVPTHDQGTVVVIQGPRFSTKAESKEFSRNGWEVINMTQYPEGILAKELGICYVNIALITDYDAGLEGNPDIKPVTHEEVLKVFSSNNDKLKKLLLAMIDDLQLNPECNCKNEGIAGL